MKIQYASDLHLDHAINRERLPELLFNEHGADVLVLAGDFGGGCFHGDMLPDNYRQNVSHYNKFLKKARQNWKHVVCCWGNHDMWHGCLPVDYFGHIYDIGNVRFICTPLFSQIPLARMLSEDMKPLKWFDLRQIESPYGGNIKCHEYNHYNDRCLDWLRKQLEALPEDMSKHAVVVSHHLPLQECVSLNYRGDPDNVFFSNDLSKLIDWHQENLRFWIHGHSHDVHELDVYGVKVVRNPIGYLKYSEGKDYKNRYLEIN